jgi:hypothetical protein
MTDRRFVVWDRGHVLKLGRDVARLAAEIAPDGYPEREVGLDESATIIHRKPSDIHRHGDYGLLDGPPIDVDVALRRGDAHEIDERAFLELWNLPTPPPPPHHARSSHSRPLGRLRGLWRRR